MSDIIFKNTLLVINLVNFFHTILNKIKFNAHLKLSKSKHKKTITANQKQNTGKLQNKDISTKTDLL